MTTLYREAHEKVRAALNAGADDAVVFTGSGATGAINKLIACMGLRIPDTLQSQFGCAAKIHNSSRPLVVRSRMEHHSNDLPWQESINVTEYVGYDKQGGSIGESLSTSCKPGTRTARSRSAPSRPHPT